MNKNSTCAVNGCDRDSAYNGLCKTHDKYAGTGIKVEDMKPIAQRYPKTDKCIAGGCTKSPESRNLCSSHYTEFLNGAPIPNVPGRPVAQRPDCAFDSCGNKIYGNKLCKGHYAQNRRGKELTPLKPYAAPVKHLPCTFPDCENNQSARGYCKPHYGQFRDGRKLTPISEMRKPAATRDDSGRKWCSACGEFKPESAFTSSGRALDGLEHRCSACMVAKGRKYWESGSKRTRRYGMTPDELQDLYEAQDGKCATCLEPLGDRTTIDHDHNCCPENKSCGKCVRGILCHHCNVALGFTKDNPETLRRMIAYLANTTAKAA